MSLPRSRASAARGRSGGTPARWILTCEHARFSLPRAYRSLGLRRAEIQDHIGWDIGAHAVQREVARLLGAPYVASRWSRLLVDCNRGAGEATDRLDERRRGRAGQRGVSAAGRRRLRDYCSLPRRRRHHDPTRARQLPAGRSGCSPSTASRPSLPATSAPSRSGSSSTSTRISPVASAALSAAAATGSATTSRTPGEMA